MAIIPNQSSDPNFQRLLNQYMGQLRPSHPPGLPGGWAPSLGIASGAAAAYEPMPQDHSALPMQTTFGEIIAWRAWKFDKGRLVSPYTKDAWLPGEVFTANANPWTTNAGIFAHKRPEHVLKQESNWTVVGTALLWGDVVEHEHGYRAEFARPFEFQFFAEDITPGFQQWLVKEFTELKQ